MTGSYLITYSILCPGRTLFRAFWREMARCLRNKIWIKRPSTKNSGGYRSTSNVSVLECWIFLRKFKGPYALTWKNRSSQLQTKKAYPYPWGARQKEWIAESPFTSRPTVIDGFFRISRRKTTYAIYSDKNMPPCSECLVDMDRPHYLSWVDEID